jgi:carboxyl-terminal processing protease
MDLHHGRLAGALLCVTLVAGCGGGGSDGGSAAQAAPPAPATPALAPFLSGAGLLSFTPQAIGTTSTPLSVTLTNTGSAPLVFQDTTVSGPFAISSSTCAGTLQVSGSCTIATTFTPAAGGAASGRLTIASNLPGGAFIVTLMGTGIAATGWTAGQFRPSQEFAGRCDSPRTAVSAVTGRSYGDRQGTTLDERNWLRSWTNELYLWYDEVPDTDPALAASTAQFFDGLKSPARDRFHFTYPTAQWEQLSQSGVSAGYGASFVLLATSPPRRAVVAYTEAGSPAAAAGITRGAEILAVDSVDLVNANDTASIATLNAGLFPNTAGQTHTFTIRDPGSATTRLVTLQSANVTSVPVQNTAAIATAGGPVGYLLFNDHIATSEQGLVNAITTLRAAAVTDLVIDLRYNGGGFLDIASELAFMVAGPARTTGRTFELLQFNRKYPTTNPVTGQPLAPLPFLPTTQGFSLTAGQALPTLDLGRVFVLTGPETCSASESLINALQGVDVQVVQVGSRTCGKPYGFYPRDNCGTTYFSIQFRGVNAKGFGDYADGFVPANAAASPGVRVPGCSVTDDFTRALGDPAEARLAAALDWRTTGSCGVPPSGTVRPQSAEATEGYVPPRGDGVMLKTPLQQNRILGGPRGPE